MTDRAILAERFRKAAAAWKGSWLTTVDVHAEVRDLPVIADALEATGPANAVREWVSPIKTVADLVNNLLTLDQAMDVYGAYFIDQTEDRCRARGLSLSREHVVNGRIKPADDVPYSLVVWSAIDQRAVPALSGDPA